MNTIEVIGTLTAKAIELNPGVDFQDLGRKLAESRQERADEIRDEMREDGKAEAFGQLKNG